MRQRIGMAHREEDNIYDPPTPNRETGMAMNCPKCRSDFPKGAKFCQCCGFEPTKRSRLTLVATSILAAIIILILAIDVTERDWLGIVVMGVLLAVWTWVGINNYLWLRWTKPVGSDKTAAPEGRQSQQ